MIGRRSYRALAKGIIACFSPSLLAAIQARRGRRLIHKLAHERGTAAKARQLGENYHDTICGGPFAGLMLPRSVYRQDVSTLLTGEYEAELHPFIVRLAAISFTTVIDIGASIGYYAVGLARIFPNAQVIAFEADPWSRSVMREFASINAISNLKVFGTCTPPRLRTACASVPTLLLCDCEGGEIYLLTPARVSGLSTATMIVETHDHLVTNSSAVLAARFAHSHTIEMIHQEMPDQERHPYQTWMMLTPNQAGG